MSLHVAYNSPSSPAGTPRWDPRTVTEDAALSSETLRCRPGAAAPAKRPPHGEGREPVNATGAIRLIVSLRVVSGAISAREAGAHLSAGTNSGPCAPRWALQGPVHLPTAHFLSKVQAWLRCPPPGPCGSPGGGGAGAGAGGAVLHPLFLCQRRVSCSASSKDSAAPLGLPICSCLKPSLRTSHQVCWQDLQRVC